MCTLTSHVRWAPALLRRPHVSLLYIRLLACCSGGVIDVLVALSSNPQIVFVFLREDMSTAIPAL